MSDKLRHLLQIEKVLYLCTDQFVASILPGLGNDVTSQLYSADYHHRNRYTSRLITDL